MENQNRQNTRYHASLVEKLNALLIDLQIFSTNAEAYQWNTVGEQLFLFREKFEELYCDLNEK
jgi:DNA-binding ferritin-like protein